MHAKLKMVKSKKSDSILRIKHFSDSEDDPVQDEDNIETDDVKDQNQENESQSNSEIENGEVEENGQSPSINSKNQIIKKKIRKKGIIYIGNIPKHMNVAICRELMEQFGEVGRIFLQPDSIEMAKKPSKKKKKNVIFKEGWVEFEKKKVAKFVAQHINNTPISRKKSSNFCDVLWSLKYLPGFKWIHLSERLTYERAVQHQRKQMAIGKARKEANFFQSNLDKSEKLEKKKLKSQK